MTQLKIYHLEDVEENNLISTLEEGQHIIGRGNILTCNDKKVSRKHAIINVNAGSASITSVHINPCFYRPFGGNIRILPQNETVFLNNNDQFSLLPTTFWYKVKLISENGENEISSVPRVESNIFVEELDRSKTLEESWPNTINTPLNKRSHEDSDEVNKRLKVSTNDDNEEQNSRSSRSRSNSLDRLLSESLNDSYCNAVTQQVVDTSENNIEVKKEVPFDKEQSSKQNKVKDELVEPVIEEEPAHSNIKKEPLDSAEETNSNCDPNKNNNDVNSDSGPSCSTNIGNNSNPTPRRDRCWYGVNCYRKNPQHRSIFSHPGDQDYDSDPSDDRPVCPYDPACYRTNLAHRRQYKHSGKPAPKPSKPNFVVSLGCPCCPHCNGGGNFRKPDYESDYDDDDSGFEV